MNEIKKSFEEKVARPIAALIPAVPGWRAVLFIEHGETPDGYQQIAIRVLPIEAWALDAPTVDLPPPDPTSSIGFRLFGGPPPFMTRSFAPWPVNPETGERFGEELRRIVPPCKDTDAQLVKAAQEWCAKTVEIQRAIEEKKPPTTP